VPNEKLVMKKREQNDSLCPVTGCIYNISGRCLHALRPGPENCPYRYTASRLSRESVVSFSRSLSDRPASLAPA
jgi:hypothetical protein